MKLLLVSVVFLLPFLVALIRLPLWGGENRRTGTVVNCLAKDKTYGGQSSYSYSSLTRLVPRLWFSENERSKPFSL